VGRSLLDVVDTHDRLQQLGVGLGSAKEQIDTTTPAGRLQFQMLAGFAEFERATTRERTQDGLHRALRNGKQPGRVPYGYRISEDGEFEVVEDEARIVSQLFTNVAEGSSIYREVQRLNREGVPAPGYRNARAGAPRMHGRRWNSTCVSEMLRSPTYIGKHRAKVNGGKETITRDVPPIVTRELFERTKEAAKRNRRTRVGRDGNPQGLRHYLLSGLIRCGVCGKHCTANSVKDRKDPEKRWQYYACSDGRGGEWTKKGPEGHARYIPADWLEEVVWKDVRGFIENPGDYLSRIRDEIAGDANTDIAELERRRDDYATRLAAKQAERTRYIEIAARNPDLPAEKIDAHMADLRTQVDNLAMLLEHTESELAQRRAQVEVADTTETWLRKLKGRMHEVEGDTEEHFFKRRQLAQLLVSRIVIEARRKVSQRRSASPTASMTRRSGGRNFAECPETQASS
jgi:site-specific DNA recombinase